LFMFIQNACADPTVGPSIMDTLEKVMAQVEYHCFADLNSGFIDRLYWELCLIISEVLVLQPYSFIKINGSVISVHLVQEVYSNLHCEHLRLAFDNLCNVTSPIRNKKAYLRTVLYNVFFEIESHSLIGDS